MVEKYYGNEPMDDLNNSFHLCGVQLWSGPHEAVAGSRRREGFQSQHLDDNVEVIAAGRIGRETVTYVSDIYQMRRKAPFLRTRI